jgi:hypothetical protein
MSVVLHRRSAVLFVDFLNINGNVASTQPITLLEVLAVEINNGYMGHCCLSDFDFICYSNVVLHAANIFTFVYPV